MKSFVPRSKFNYGNQFHLLMNGRQLIICKVIFNEKLSSDVTV